MVNFILLGDDTDETILLQGTEDGGSLVVAIEGQTTTFQPYNFEDAGALVPTTTFVPVVYAMSTDEYPNQYNLPVQSAEVTTEARADLDSLLDGMDTSLDKRLTVGTWIRESPLAAARFTPMDVERILSKVSFSLEQATVAAEIAAGMENSNTLTCEHIIAAMTACGYQAAEVAKTMAPTVNDPQNKHRVLEIIEYSFERSGVERAFPK